MELTELIVVIIFSLTYLLIAFHRTPWFKIERYYVAAAGAVLMIVFGTISLTDAFDSINFKVIYLLIGMMSMVAGLEHAGFFTLVTRFLLTHTGDRFRLISMIMVSSAVLSAIALNDAVVLMFTPIVIRCCVRLNANPIPFLVGTMMSANIGSVATAVGNPQNAYVLSVSEMDFLTYSMYAIPISIVCLILTIGILWFYYRNSMDPIQQVEVDDQDREIRRMPLRFMIAVLIATIVAFSLSGLLGYELYQVALISGGLALLMVLLTDHRDATWLVRRIDWGTVLFFIGFFVIIGAASISGLIGDISRMFPSFESSGASEIFSLSIISAVMSNIVSNVPAVMLLAEMIPSSNTTLWITLAVSSTLAGNTTLIGSAANMIVAERSERYGVSFDFFRFMVIGVIVTIMTMIVADLMIVLMCSH